MKNKISAIFAGLLVIILIAQVGCNEEQNIGLDILPTEDVPQTSITDTVSINLHTVRSESLITSGTSVLLLGSYIDDDFGKVKAGFATQVNQIEYPDFPEDATLVSLELHIPLVVDDMYYGNSTIEQEFSIYELQTVLYDSLSYYSDQDMESMHLGNLVGQQTFTLNQQDSTIILQLNDELGQRFLDEADAYFYSFGVPFSEIFKGLYVCPTGNNFTDAAIYKIDGQNENFSLNLYYSTASNPETTTSFKMPVFYEGVYDDLDGVNFSVFEHDYQGVSFENQLENPFSITDTVAFLHSMAGTRIRIQMPTVSNFADKNITINKAELIVKTDETLTIKPTNSLALVGYDNNDEIIFFEDYYQPSTGIYLGEVYDDDKKRYTFNMTRTIQALVSGQEQNFDFYLVDKEAAFNYNKTIITNGNNSNPTKLVITYTKY